jgi:DNA-binding transcriptional ArsR family regulator
MGLLPDILSSRARAEIFRLLFGISAEELHVREIERRSGLAIRTVSQELKKLEEMDLVAARRDGNRLYYSANRDHPLYNDIRNMVMKTVGLAGILSDALAGAPISVAFVFGSLARGGENAQSDVDLMVIAETGLREVSRLLAGVSERIGREVNPHVMSAGEFMERRRAEDHFLKRVIGSPKLFVVGDEDELARLG